jgi:Spy/CpxP family protein refolding chaperone
MKRLVQITLAAAVVAMAVSPALAQQQQRQRGFGGFGGMSTIYLLGQKSVQEELKLSEEQVKKITELQEKQRESFQGLRDLSQEERRTKMQEMVKAQSEAVAKILDAKQHKRAMQISLQQQVKFGLAFALNNEELAKSLKVTDEQKEKIREVQRSAFEQMRDLGRDEEGRKKREELMKTANEKVEGALTSEQKTKLKEMQGEPFKGEIQRPQFGGRRNR